MDSQMDVLVSVLALLTWFAALSFYADILSAAPSAPLEVAGGHDRAQPTNNLLARSSRA
jgi:hypothetical protein